MESLFLIHGFPIHWIKNKKKKYPFGINKFLTYMIISEVKQHHAFGLTNIYDTPCMYIT